MAYAEPTSSVYISEAITSNSSAIDNDAARDMRQEYLKIINQESVTFKHKKNELYRQIVKPVYRSLNIQPTTIEFTIEVIDTEKDTVNTIKIRNPIITMGRLSDNDVFLSDNNEISRMHGYMFVAGEKIIFLDIWSFAGTQTIQRSDKTQPSLSTMPKKRNILMFNYQEIIHLKMAECIDVLIIPQAANRKLLKSFGIYQFRQSIKPPQIDNKINGDQDEEKNNDNLLTQTNGKKKLNQRQKDFKIWLCEELDLSEYYQLFIENGFDDIDVVKLLDDTQLKELGIDKKGSRMKLMLYSKKATEKPNHNVADNTQNNKDNDSTDLFQNCSSMIAK